MAPCVGSYTQGVACNQRQSYRYIVDWPAKYFQMDWNTIIGVKPPYIAQLAGLIGRSISFLNRVVWKVMSSPKSDNYFSKSCAQSPALHVGLYGKTIKMR